MRVYSKVVLDIDTGLILEEESYEYHGQVAECKSGGAGGGSPAGTIVYPAHMTTAHQAWLDHTGSDTIASSVTDLMNEAMSGPSPFSGFETVDVDAAFLGPYKTVSNYVGPFDRLQDLSCFNVEAKYDEYVNDEDAKVTAAVQAHSDLLDNELLENDLPRFKAGLADFNAVQASNFISGEALIWDSKAKRLAKFDAGLRVEMITRQSEIAIRRIGVFIEFGKILTSLATEITRIYIAARHDIDTLYSEIAAKDKLFDLNVYQYGVNVMSSIAGSAVSPPDPGSNKTGMGGPLSGALAGASIGAQTSNPYGVVIGAVLGAVAGTFYD